MYIKRERKPSNAQAIFGTPNLPVFNTCTSDTIIEHFLNGIVAERKTECCDDSVLARVTVYDNVNPDSREKGFYHETDFCNVILM